MTHNNSERASNTIPKMETISLSHNDVDTASISTSTDNISPLRNPFRVRNGIKSGQPEMQSEDENQWLPETEN